MQRRIAIKRLTASDLTLFEWQFRNKNAGNQKSINLNADVFISEMFPSLPEIAATRNWRVSIDLSIYGPGRAGLLNLQRKIMKGSAYKNWRLNGEFIADPPGSPDRFRVLEPGDFVVFDFVGTVVPDAAKMLLVAKMVDADKFIHDRLSLLLGTKNMLAVSVAQLQAIADHVDDDHPIHELTLDAELEDAAQGGASGLSKLGRRPLTRIVGRDELQRARQAGEEIGRAGEEFVLVYLTLLKANQTIRDFTWVSDINAVAPYDFLIILANGDEVALDVKSTGGEFERPIHVSSNELAEMTNPARRYDLYRAFEITERTAKLRVVENVANLAQVVRQQFEGMPDGVTVDSISIKPGTLPFGMTITLAMPDTDELGQEG